MQSKGRTTTIEGITKYAVQLNGILIPAKSVESALCHYTQLLTVANDDETYSIGLMGSATGIFYRNHYLLLCTRHQLKILEGRPYEQVGLLDKDGKYFCSAGGIRHYVDDVNEFDLHDLVVFDFTAPCLARPNMRERFFPFANAPPEIRSDRIIAFIASGYPSKEQDYGLTENERRLGLTRAQIICQCAPSEDQLEEDPTLLRLVPMEPLRFNPNGISGGATFVLQIVDSIPQAFFAGMIVRAGLNDLYILKAGFIQKFVNTWLDA